MYFKFTSSYVNLLVWVCTVKCGFEIIMKRKRLLCSTQISRQLFSKILKNLYRIFLGNAPIDFNLYLLIHFCNLGAFYVIHSEGRRTNFDVSFNKNN